MKHAIVRLKELVVSQISPDAEGYLTVLHAGVPDQGQALADDLAHVLSLNSVPVYDMPPAIVTHGGPGILGVAFFTKE
jgi:fatty acid-binding protein DegV